MWKPILIASLIPTGIRAIGDLYDCISDWWDDEPPKPKVKHLTVKQKSFIRREYKFYKKHGKTISGDKLKSLAGLVVYLNKQMNTDKSRSTFERIWGTRK